MSNYTPITDKDISAMLNKLNAKNIDSLFDIIPDKFKYNIDDLAKQCKTISHEILTSISNRVERVYV